MRTLEYLDIAIPSYAEQVETWKRLRRQRYEAKPLALPAPKPEIRYIVPKLVEPVVDPYLAAIKSRLEIATDAEKAVLNNLTSLPALICKITATFFNKPVEILFDKNKKQDILVYRHIAIAEVSKFTKLSTTKMAQFFGKDNHTTIMYAVKKIEKLRLKDQVFNYYLCRLDAEIESQLKKRKEYQTYIRKREKKRRAYVSHENKFKWPEKAVQNAIALCSAGTSQKEIAVIISGQFDEIISPAAVSSMLRRKGFSILKARKSLKRFSKARENQCLKNSQN